MSKMLDQLRIFTMPLQIYSSLQLSVKEKYEKQEQEDIQKIANEYKLIQGKESRLSRMQRDKIVSLAIDLRNKGLLDSNFNTIQP